MYSCDGSSLLQSSALHVPSEIIQSRFGAQETFPMIISHMTVNLCMSLDSLKQITIPKMMTELVCVLLLCPCTWANVLEEKKEYGGKHEECMSQSEGVGVTLSAGQFSFKLL